MDQLIHRTNLKNSVLQRKQEFLICLHNAIESHLPLLYEKAVIVLAELMDIDYLNKSQLTALNSQLKAVRTLAPKRNIEETSYAQTRIISATSLLCRLDKWHVDWTDDTSEEIIKANGLPAVMGYLEQDAHEQYKANAAQVVGMMAENGSINQYLVDKNAVGILTDGLKHRSLLVKRNFAESLAFLIKDHEVRRKLEMQLDPLLDTVLTEFKTASDQVYSENLLLCLMHLSYHKPFKPAVFEADIVDQLLHNIANGRSEEEVVYSIRVLINLCFSPDSKASIYEWAAIPLSNGAMYNKPNAVLIQVLLLYKKCVEGEKSDLDVDKRVLEFLVHCCKHEDKAVFETGFNVVRAMMATEGKKTVDVLLQEFETKGSGIQICINFYGYPAVKVIEDAARLLVLFAKHGYVQEINFQGRQELIQNLLSNFSHQNEAVRSHSIQLTAYLLNDIDIHEMVFEATNFNFLLWDIQNVLGFEELFPEEQSLLMFSLKIFGEMSKTPKMVDNNMQNGLLPLLLRILEDEDRYSKEVWVWALIILNRGCMHHGLAHEFLDRLLKIDPPLFLEFILHVSSLDELDFTMHTRLVWQEIARQAQAGSQALIQPFLDNVGTELVERLLIAAKKTKGSKSDIHGSIKSTLEAFQSNNPDLDKVVKDTAKRLKLEGKDEG